MALLNRLAQRCGGEWPDPCSLIPDPSLRPSALQSVHLSNNPRIHLLVHGHEENLLPESLRIVQHEILFFLQVLSDKIPEYPKRFKSACRKAKTAFTDGIISKKPTAPFALA
jgi:hypothetical protein